MKLLLTSFGITNKAIEGALASLLNKDLSDAVVAHIPTAANIEDDVSWMHEELETLKATGIKELLSVDIANLSKEEWLPMFEKADVIYFGGGNTYFLLHWVRTSGLINELDNLLKLKVYVGSSAGSIIVGPDISLNRDRFPEEEIGELEDLSGLNYVPFITIPHLNSSIFPNTSEEKTREIAQKTIHPVYAIDDNSAVKVFNEKIEVVSEGKWFVLGQ